MGFIIETQSNGSKGLEEFRQGLTRLRDGKLDDAALHFRRAFEQDRENPFYISYQGLLVGLVQRKWADAEQLCETAVQRNRTHAQLYLNLADVYLQAGRKEDAIETLRRGAIYNPRDLRIHNALETLGTRRQPLIRFLSRRNVLNRTLGRLRHMLVRAA
jgi:tetratricopeptide (TPR) repeat protein